MKYFDYVQRKQFTQALSCLPPRLRYVSSRQRWYALRLGLYQTILQHVSQRRRQSRRHHVVATIAAVKRQIWDKDKAQAAIKHILNQKRYDNFHTELIKEIITNYPQVAFEYLKNDTVRLNSTYYQGLYLALLQQYQFDIAKLCDYTSKFVVNNLQADYADRYCLYNNIILENTQSRLANLNKIFAHHKLSSIGLIGDQAGFTVANLSSLPAKRISDQLDKTVPKVTVIVTTYNASATINSCIHSLMQQSWSNLEVIVVDDASTDDTLLQLQRLKRKYSVLKVIALPKNTGTFAAKSIGAEYATGEFLTCQDSDDWAHPQKIAEQVEPLIKDTSLIATTSYWLRLDHNGQYYVRQVYPFLRQNPASPMFRLSKVKKDTGLWHIVRTGADSEFFERLKLFYGKQSIKAVKKPLTIASHRPNSLMTSKEFGAYDIQAALARLDYWEAWRLWHIDTLYHKCDVFMPSVQQQADISFRLFAHIPDSITVNHNDLKQNLVGHKILSTR